MRQHRTQRAPLWAASPPKSLVSLQCGGRGTGRVLMRSPFPLRYAWRDQRWLKRRQALSSALADVGAAKNRGLRLRLVPLVTRMTNPWVDDRIWPLLDYDKFKVGRTPHPPLPELEASSWVPSRTRFLPCTLARMVATDTLLNDGNPTSTSPRTLC